MKKIASTILAAGMAFSSMLPLTVCADSTEYYTDYHEDEEVRNVLIDFIDRADLHRYPDIYDPEKYRLYVASDFSHFTVLEYFPEKRDITVDLKEPFDNNERSAFYQYLKVEIKKQLGEDTDFYLYVRNDRVYLKCTGRDLKFLLPLIEEKCEIASYDVSFGLAEALYTMFDRSYPIGTFSPTTYNGYDMVQKIADKITSGNAPEGKYSVIVGIDNVPDGMYYETIPESKFPDTAKDFTEYVAKVPLGVGEDIDLRGTFGRSGFYFMYENENSSDEDILKALGQFNKELEIFPMIGGMLEDGGKVSTADITYESTELLDGDANCDGVFTIADATIILQSLGNPDKYSLSLKGAFNADIYNVGDGVTGLDALEIQRVLARK